jgi:hypothetical protein
MATGQARLVFWLLSCGHHRPARLERIQHFEMRYAVTLGRKSNPPDGRSARGMSLSLQAQQWEKPLFAQDTYALPRATRHRDVPPPTRQHVIVLIRRGPRLSGGHGTCWLDLRERIRHHIIRFRVSQRGPFDRSRVDGLVPDQGRRQPQDRAKDDEAAHANTVSIGYAIECPC